MAASGSGQSTTDEETYLRRLLSLSDCTPQLYDEIESEIVSNAGDVGVGALRRKRLCTCRPPFSNDQGVAFPISQELLEFYGLWVPSDTITPLSPDATQEEKLLLPSLEDIAYLIYLAVFGILGVLTRYLLRKVFGPGGARVTSNHNILYLDLLSNMVGSFLIGWCGLVFIDNISHLSDQLAVGLSIGYVGSLTTFSGWNQEMVDLSFHGHKVSAILGYIIGFFLTAYSTILGVETAMGFRGFLRSRNWSTTSNFGVVIAKGFKWIFRTRKGLATILTILMLIWGCLLVTFAFLEEKELKNGSKLWLACLVSPFGVWVRWWLAGLNGHGLGSARLWRWIPLGTLVANVLGACGMAALTTLKTTVDSKTCDAVTTGIQFGLMNCLSNVSMFMAEFYTMQQRNGMWRAFAYAFMTIGLSFGLGTLIYSVPVWTTRVPGSSMTCHVPFLE